MAASLIFPSQKGVTWMDMLTETTQNFCWRKGQLVWAAEQQQWHLVLLWLQNTGLQNHPRHSIKCTTASPGQTPGRLTHLTQILLSESIYRKWAPTRMSTQGDTDPAHLTQITQCTAHSNVLIWAAAVSNTSACEVYLNFMQINQ